ncbi:CsbD family protein [Reichenbachiella ulvae]|uniref:CsbD family protein n=1 Tax=Reichenbachiella ulvae TaxID=2980104 RepID=A0ABT3CWA5_9BACT|nr:CsbD family protein [Reichenbachiella ulvae]MCV9387750.1 CsbD family protein [Reichenbachiella ulvae]
MELQLEATKNIIKGKLKEKFGELTNDDLKMLEGTNEQIIGKLEKKLGKEGDDLLNEINDWLQSKTL